ncbi:MAG: secondary thiamine-phosphate synthase enzyme YjbQ [Saprospiraceae bacterium]|nr:secondary thiamine-phosphate synthase enzyme YjbQ [Saprospiraceae bacterium]
MRFRTKGHTDIINLTESVAETLSQSNLREGTVTISAIGSTTGITTLEFEPGLAQTDVAAMLEEIAPYNRNYAHNATWGDDNGAAHLRSALIGTSKTVPFVDAQLMLGTWQQIVFIDFDTRPRERQVVVQVMGK